MSVKPGAHLPTRHGFPIQSGECVKIVRLLPSNRNVFMLSLTNRVANIETGMSDFYKAIATRLNCDYIATGDSVGIDKRT